MSSIKGSEFNKGESVPELCYLVKHIEMLKAEVWLLLYYNFWLMDTSEIQKFHPVHWQDV